MNQNVPVSREMEDNYSAPNRHQNQATGEERIRELVWQNGPVEMQSQNKKPPKNVGTEVVIPAENEIRIGREEQLNLFMQDDELAFLFQIPLQYYSSFDHDLSADLLNTVPPPPTPLITEPPPRVTAEIRHPPPLPPPLPTPLITEPPPRVTAEIRHPPPPPPPPVRPVGVAPTVSKPETGPRMQNFAHFSMIRSRSMHKPPEATMAREATVVESNETPSLRPTEQARVMRSVAESSVQLNVESGAGTTGELSLSTFDFTVTSSPSGSRANSDAQQRPAVVVAEDRKRKAMVEHDDGGCQSEDVEFEATEARKQAHNSTSTKRSRAAEFHSLSERRRRDKINEKIRILQELIPRCSKSDKASVLDKTIEYLKCLKMQVQMLTMMMYSGVQNYMPLMGMDMAMNNPMVTYPSMQPGQSMPGPANMDPRFHMPPPFPMPQVPLPSPSQAQPCNQMNQATNFPYYPNQTQMLNYVDLYRQFLSMQQAQLPQSQGDKPSTSKEPGNPD